MQKESTYYLVKGYPGLEGMAEQISKYFPSNPIHVEPFAGLGRTVGYSKASTIILNDLSGFAVSYLRETYPNSIVTQEDFVEIIKKYRENPDVFMFLDPPWRKNIYKNNESPVFTMKNITDYYIHIFYWLNDDKTKCNWLLCSDRDRHEIGVCIKNTGYNSIELEHSTKKLYNRPLAVQLVGNIPL